MDNCPLNRLQKLLPTPNEVLSHNIRPWQATTFTGENHQMVVRAPDHFLTQMSTFDLDTTLTGWLVVNADVTRIDDDTFEIDILLLKE